MGWGQKLAVETAWDRYRFYPPEAINGLARLALRIALDSANLIL